MRGGGGSWCGRWGGGAEGRRGAEGGRRGEGRQLVDSGLAPSAAPCRLTKLRSIHKQTPSRSRAPRESTPVALGRKPLWTVPGMVVGR